MYELYKLALELKIKSEPKDLKELSKLTSALLKYLSKFLTESEITDLLKE